jgi:hypothetical protein
MLPPVIDETTVTEAEADAVMLSIVDAIGVKRAEVLVSELLADEIPGSGT